MAAVRLSTIHQPHLRQFTKFRLSIWKISSKTYFQNDFWTTIYMWCKIDKFMGVTLASSLSVFVLNLMTSNVEIFGTSWTQFKCVLRRRRRRIEEQLAARCLGVSSSLSDICQWLLPRGGNSPAVHERAPDFHCAEQELSADREANSPCQQSFPLISKNYEW